MCDKNLSLSHKKDHYGAKRLRSNTAYDLYAVQSKALPYEWRQIIAHLPNTAKAVQRGCVCLCPHNNFWAKWPLT